MSENSKFVPLLTTTDWNDEWIKLQKARDAADNAAHWDERSKTFHKSFAPNPYVQRFIELSDFQPKDTVLDMGCGNGALAIPLAIAGHEIVAADFSKGMLSSLKDEASKHGSLSIRTELMSWADDWAAHSIGENCVDVAIASRSIATKNLRESLEKLSRTARRRCCITLPTGSSPRSSEAILFAIGIAPKLGRDFLYAFMILNQMGYHPEVQYIPSVRYDTYDSEQEAFDSIKKMIDHVGYEVLSTEELNAALDRLKKWLPENLEENPEVGQDDGHGSVQKALRLSTPREVKWSFISWNVTKDYE